MGRVSRLQGERWPDDGTRRARISNAGGASGEALRCSPRRRRLYEAPGSEGDRCGGDNGRKKLNVGLIGLGRLGRVYARDLATRIPCTRLAAVADLSQTRSMDAVVREYDVPLSSTDPERVINDPSVDAVVIVTPTDTHGDGDACRGRRRQGDLLREAARHLARRRARR